MATLINETYMDLLKGSGINPSDIQQDMMAKNHKRMTDRAAALASSAFTRGIDALKNATSAMTPTFLMGKKLHDQLTTILDSINNQTDLLDYSKTQTALMKEMRKAQKADDEERVKILEEQLAALERLKDFVGSDDQALFEKILNRQTVDEEAAGQIIDTAKSVSADLKVIAPVGQVDSSTVVPSMNDRISDIRLGRDYRRSVAKETVRFLKQAPTLRENPQLTDIERLLEGSRRVSDQEFTDIAATLKGYEKVALSGNMANQQAMEALHALKKADNRHDRRDAMERVIQQLSAFPQFAQEVIDMQKAFSADGKMNAHTSKKVSALLQKVQQDTTNEKIVYNLKELNNKFDESLLDNESVRSELTKNNLGNRFMDNPGIIAAGKGIASTAISGLLNALGLGNFDAALGISDSIVGGIGAAGEYLMQRRATRKGIEAGLGGPVERGRNRLPEGSRKTGRASRGVGGFMRRTGGKVAGVIGGIAGAVGLKRALTQEGVDSANPRQGSASPLDAPTPDSQSRAAAKKEAGEARRSRRAAKRVTGRTGGKIGGMTKMAGVASGLGKGLGRGGLTALKGVGRVAGVGARLLGPIAMAAMAAVDGADGWNNAADIAGLKKGEEATFTQKSQAALASVASGLSFGLIDPKTIYAGLDKVTATVGNAGTFIMDAVSGGLSTAADYMNKFVTDSMGKLGEGWDAVKNWGTGGWATVQALGADTLKSVTDIGKNMLETSTKFLGDTGLKGLIFGPAGLAINTALEFLQNPNKMADLIDRAKNLASNLNPMNWFSSTENATSVSPNMYGQPIPLEQTPGRLDPEMAYQGGGVEKGKKANLATRNFNPGNIRASANNNWVGKVGQEGGFEKFDTVVHGTRAWFKLARKHVSREGMTLRQLITKLSPPNENNTEKYVQAVSKAAGVDPDAKLDPNDQKVMTSIAKEVFRQEGFQGSISDMEMLDAWNGTENHAKYSKQAIANVNAAVNTALQTPTLDKDGKMVTPMSNGTPGKVKAIVPASTTVSGNRTEIPGITPISKDVATKSTPILPGVGPISGADLLKVKTMASIPATVNPAAANSSSFVATPSLSSVPRATPGFAPPKTSSTSEGKPVATKASVTPVPYGPTQPNKEDPFLVPALVQDKVGFPDADLVKPGTLSPAVPSLTSPTPIVKAKLTAVETRPGVEVADVSASRAAAMDSQTKLQTASTVAMMQTSSKTTEAVKENTSTKAVPQGASSGGSSSGNGTTKAAKNIDDLQIMAINNSSF